VIDAAFGAIRLVASCVLAVLAIAAVGQAEPPKPLRFVVQSWRAESGLPGDQVLQIARTRQGYLYVGTTNGLARFDGVRFRSFTLDDGLRPGRIVAIHEDRKGTLWVGTSGGGLARLEGHRFVSLTRVDGLPSNTVTAIAEDGRGRLWIGTNRGIALWDGRRLCTPEGFEHLTGCSVMAILCARDDVVWVATYRSGLFTFGRGGWSESDASGLLGAGKTCYALFEDHAGRIWASTDHEIVLRRDAEGWTRCRVQRDPSGSYAYVQEFAEDADGIIWCALPHGNLNFFRGGRDDAEEYRFTTSTAEVCCVLGDPAGGIWIGTGGMGLHRLMPPKVSILVSPLTTLAMNSTGLLC
jgi:ligand-binding sensor domain-containing protein